MSPGHPRVGVVVLNYRGAADTIACIESLQKLDEPARLVVVDNGSGDGSVEQLGAVAGIELIANVSNVGFAAGNNVAIDRLLDDGIEFVWVLNNDTVVEPSALQRTARGRRRRSWRRCGRLGALRPCRPAPLADVGRWRRAAVDRSHARCAHGVRPARLPDGRVGAPAGSRHPAGRVLRHAVLLHVGGRRPGRPLDPRWLAVGGRRALPRLAPLGWHARTAGPARFEHHAAGLVVFQRTHSRAPWLTTLPMLGYYAASAVRHRRPALWRGAWRGWRAGWSR